MICAHVLKMAANCEATSLDALQVPVMQIFGDVFATNLRAFYAVLTKAKGVSAR
jgi:hypothetical protein